MSDCFVRFSGEITNVTLEESNWWEELLAYKAEFDDKGEIIGEPPPGFDDEDPEWGFEWYLNGDHGYLCSMDWANVDSLAGAVRGFLKQFRPTEVFKMSWVTFSNSVYEEPSGGAMIVTAESIRMATTWEWLQDYPYFLVREAADSGRHSTLHRCAGSATRHACQLIKEYETQGEANAEVLKMIQDQDWEGAYKLWREFNHGNYDITVEGPIAEYTPTSEVEE